MSRRPPPRSRKSGGPRRGRARPSEVLEVAVEDLGGQGDGIAAWAGRKFYIPRALPGEKVRVRTGPKRGDGVACTLLDVLDPAPDRVTPICPVYQRCGGCALQHLNPDTYGALKRDRVVDALAKRGLAGEGQVLEPVLIGPHTRRRVTFTAEHKGGKVVLGFNAAASHAVVDVEACPLLIDGLNVAIEPLKGLLAQILGDCTRARIALTDADDALDVLIEADCAPDLAAREAIAAFAAHGQGARVAWKEGRDAPEPIIQTRQPHVTLGGTSVELPPGAFLQASTDGERALTDQVLAAVAGAGRVADLFCGLGTFALPIARAGAVVRAVDGLDAPVRALERAAGRADLGGRVLAEVRDLEQNPLEAKELAKFDAVVFDPPRAGAASQAEQIAQSGVSKVAAVSCNPSTFARDARILVDGGYRLIDVLPVDQFTYSAHVELVARFERNEA